MYTSAIQSEEKDGSYLVTIIQPSSDPFLKYTAGYYETIENNLLELINESHENQLIVLPEAELPYSIQRHFTNFLLKIFLKNFIRCLERRK